MRNPLPPPVPARGFSMLDHQLTTYIDRVVEKPFWIATVQPNLLDARVQVEPDVVFRFLTRQKRAYAANTSLFLWWLGGSSLVLLLVAILFLRNQIRPILQLAHAAIERTFAINGAEAQRLAHGILVQVRRHVRVLEQRLDFTGEDEQPRLG